VRETEWINANKAESIPLINARIGNLTGKSLPASLFSEAFGRLEITNDPVKSSLRASAQSAYALGFLGESEPDLSDVYDLTLLNEVLAEEGEPQIG
jgi:NitT/TauT family transport system substrate-binding protein